MAVPEVYHILGLKISVEAIEVHGVGKGVYVDFSGTPKHPEYPAAGTASRFKDLFHLATGENPRKIENPQGYMDCLFIAETPEKQQGDLYKAITTTLSTLAALEASGHTYPLNELIEQLPGGEQVMKSTPPPAPELDNGIKQMPPPRDVVDVDMDRLYLPPQQNNADALRAAVMDGILGVMSAREKMIDEDLHKTATQKGAKIQSIDAVRSLLSQGIANEVFNPLRRLGIDRFLKRADGVADVGELSEKIAPIIKEKLTADSGKIKFYAGEFAEAMHRAVHAFKDGRDSSRSR